MLDLAQERKQHLTLAFNKAESSYFEGSAYDNEEILRLLREAGAEVVNVTLADRKEDLDPSYFISRDGIYGAGESSEGTPSRCAARGRRQMLEVPRSGGGEILRQPWTVGAATTAPAAEARVRWGPLVIVGQARSGTSFLTRLLADTRRFALINDAYVIQYLDGLGSSYKLDLRRRRRPAEHVLARIRIQLVSENERQMYRSLYLAPGQLEQLQKRTNRLVVGCQTAWDLIKAILIATAELSGCEVWGWKSPPDYLHVERILTHFPEARFIFLIRDPFKMMRSYKNWPWGEGRHRYHPLVQGLLWRSVVEEFERIARDNNSRVLLVQFEDLVNQTPSLRARLTEFLGHFEWPPDGERGHSQQLDAGLQQGAHMDRVEDLQGDHGGLSGTLKL